MTRRIANEERFDALTPQLLHGWPLPTADGAQGKDDRGQVLIVAGSREIPGAAVLAATAALRAGAGKLQSATTEDVARLVAIALPEAMVLGLPHTRDGQIRGATAPLREAMAGAQAVLVGPGMRGGPKTASLVTVAMRETRGLVVVDAGAIENLGCARNAARVVLTPHAGELAQLMDVTREEVERNGPAMARQAAQRCGAVVVLKGPTTWIVAPDGPGWIHKADLPGLGTSGSGDVLAGLIAGLAARGATPAQAAVWGVWAHAQAGEVLAREVGRLGFLARELIPLLPRILELVADVEPPVRARAS